MTNEELIKAAPEDFRHYMFVVKPLQTRSGGTVVKIIAEENKHGRKGRGKSRKPYSG